MNYLELHVTFEMSPYDRKVYGDRIFSRPWKFSSIDGDPVLGSGVKCYLTRQLKESAGVDEAIKLVKASADEVKSLGFKVLRTKVEHVVYDSKTIPEELFQ